MRDGTTLCTNVFRPAGHTGPALLIRTPYGKGAQLSPNYRYFVDQGYAVVIQDVRGRHHSQGEFGAIEQETADGEDTLRWIARQAWSNGRIGMLGGSYLGIVQWRAALSGSPYLKAIFPVVAGYDEYFDRFYSRGGALKLGHRLVWLAENFRKPGARPDYHRFVLHLPLRTADSLATGRRIGFFQEALDHPLYDDYWRRRSTRERLDRVDVPVFVVGGWYDNFVQSDLEAFAELRKRSAEHRVVVGPWAHNMSYRFPEADFGPDSAAPVRDFQIEWFDKWVRGTGLSGGHTPSKPVRLFVMGADRWREDETWPPPGFAPRRLYLSSGGRANSLEGDGILSWKPPRAEPPDRFVYDPRHPVPTTGGAICCNPRVFAWGPVDQRVVEGRPDVLVYTSEPLREDLEVIGPIRAVLYVATSAPDTDFTAKLVDVFPDGRARILTDGILRLRYRESLEREAAAVPGEVYPITIDAGVTANVFLAGHRIRLEVSSSNFPRFDRNPNTGGPIASETAMRTATQTVFHENGRASHLLLPVKVPEPPRGRRQSRKKLTRRP
ncbi:MAG: CocE/NonD family hydrolase [Bryobacteraceae bacterium]